MELTKAKVIALLISILTQQVHYLPFPRDVADLLCRLRRCASRFTFTCFAIQSACFHEILHRLLEAPLTSVQVNIDTYARGTVARESQDLSLRCRVLGVEAGAHQHFFRV